MARTRNHWLWACTLILTALTIVPAYSAAPPSTPDTTLQAQGGGPGDEGTIALQRLQEAHAWAKYLYDFWYRVALTVLIGIALYLAFPTIVELGVTLPGGVGVNLKQNRKLPATPAPDSLELPAIPTEALESLRTALGATPAADRVLGKVEQIRSLSESGIPTDGIYLSHEPVGRRRGGYQRLRIYVDADEPRYLTSVQRVVYRLHPTFPNPVLEARDPTGGFSQEILAWGEFMLHAEITLVGQEKPILLSRYLNFWRG